MSEDELFDHILNGNTEEALGLISEENANVTDEDHISLLMWAAHTGLVDVIMCLLEHGADIHYMGSGRNALIFAVANNSMEAVNVLLEHGADINQCTGHFTALNWAAHRGHYEMVQYLVMRGADLGTKYRWGRTPLLEACHMNHYYLIPILATPEIVKADRRLFKEVQYDAQNLRFLLEMGMEYDYNIFELCNNNSFESVQVLLEHGYQPTHSDLYDACWYGRAQIIELLVEHGLEANVVIHGETPLGIAVIVVDRIIE